MAGSGRSEDTKKCGLVYLIIYASLFLIMSFILIGISVKVCEKVSSSIRLLSISELLMLNNSVLMTLGKI